MGRSLSPLANWRFGSIFRNSIPPARPYKVPTFEEIFETDHSTKDEVEEEPQKVVLNLNSNRVGSPTEQKNLFQFSNLLSENNRNSLSSNPQMKEMLSKLSKKDLLHEAFFETTTKPYVSTTTTQSYKEIQKLKLIERAKEELRKKQLVKDKYIRAQQKKEKFLKIIQQQKQQQLEEQLQMQKKQQLEEQLQQQQKQKTPRSQELDSFFSKINGFSDKTSLVNQLRPEVIQKYQNKIAKKSRPDKQQYWSQQETTKQQDENKKVSKINGKNYVDMSSGTIILDNNSGGSSQQSHPLIQQKTDTSSSSAQGKSFYIIESKYLA